MAVKNKIAAVALTLVLAVSALPVSAAAQEVLAGGGAVGIQMTTDGVMVAGTNKVDTASGQADPAGTAGLKTGDVITKLGDKEIHSASDFLEAAAKLDGSAVKLTVSREGKAKQLTITPAKAADGELRLGLWLRDGVTGVGTLTFYDKASGVYGALGHGITDTETGLLLPLGDGKITKATITGIIKGKSGTPGELSGASDTNKVRGSILMNTDYGIFGVLDSGDKDMGAAMQCGEMKTGKATIMTTLSGEKVSEYEVEINRVYHDEYGQRAMICVTDKALLSQTGGIVQGMSGSPIIQDGKLVGAVTHVFVNDPTKGYGLSIQDMISQAQACADKTDKAA